MAFSGHRGVRRYDGSTGDAWKGFVCGHCGTRVSGAVVAAYGDSFQRVEWLLCPECERGSVANGSSINPGVPFGPAINGMPDDVKQAYEQARRSMAARAYTGVELICRKILMHVAVEKGAGPGLKFIEYIGYLEQQGYVTPPMKPWVDVIRRHGNSAAHDIEEPNHVRAESTLMFTAELLRLTYEMAHFAAKYAPDVARNTPAE